MKFKVTLKDPDGFSDGINDAVKRALSGTTFFWEKDADSVYESRRKTIRLGIEKWVEYGEYITIEFDTTAGTATVVPLK